jgi:leader peptidase (prepilin peptidase) / N-methyltransferase
LNDQNILIAFFFWFGALWGSFANVVIVRLPKNESVIKPRSHCPQCKKLIPWYLNIPIFSWVLLRGKCQNCKKTISVRYPIVELLMGILFAAIYYRFGMTFSTFEYFIFIFGLVTASFIDLDHMILPDQFTLSGIVLGLLGALLNPDRLFLDSFLGVVLGGGVLLATAYLYFAVRKIDGMGGGDIKLLAWIGAVCGVQSLLFVILFSSVVGLIFGLIYMIGSKEGLKTGIPFGPYLSMGAIVYLIFDMSEWMNSLFLIT